MSCDLLGLCIEWWSMLCNAVRCCASCSVWATNAVQCCTMLCKSTMQKVAAVLSCAMLCDHAVLLCSTCCAMMCNASCALRCCCAMLCNANAVQCKPFICNSDFVRAMHILTCASCNAHSRCRLAGLIGVAGRFAMSGSMSVTTALKTSSVGFKLWSASTSRAQHMSMQLFSSVRQVRPYQCSRQLCRFPLFVLTSTHFQDSCFESNLIT